MLTTDEYFRPLNVRGRALLVHWLYYPDSYDSVVQLGDLGLASVPEVTPNSYPRQWKVGQRWLLDTDTFNEWMNEEDYELIQVTFPPCSFVLGDNFCSSRECLDSGNCLHR